MWNIEYLLRKAIGDEQSQATPVDKWTAIAKAILKQECPSPLELMTPSLILEAANGFPRLTVFPMGFQQCSGPHSFTTLLFVLCSTNMYSVPPELGNS